MSENFTDVEKAERLLKGYCTECYMPRHNHAKGCRNMYAVFADLVRQEIDAEILAEIIRVAKTQQDAIKNQPDD